MGTSQILQSGEPFNLNLSKNNQYLIRSFMSEELGIAPEPIRPQALTILCWLSFIGSGFGSFSNFLIYLFHADVLAIVKSGVYKDLGFDMSLITSVSQYYFLWIGVLQIAAFAGVKQMFERKRIGLHLYAIAQLLMLIVSTVYVYRPAGVFPTFDLMFSGFFILIFLRFKDVMK